jgi:hypothetical protein
MQADRLLSRYSLANGLTLEFWDRSRVAAGDRWQVVCEVRVTVPVTGATLPPELRRSLAEVTQVLGSQVVFVKQEVRNFVAVGEMARLLVEMQSWLRKSLETYLGHPDFATRLIRKRFRDHEERHAGWRSEGCEG